MGVVKSGSEKAGIETLNIELSATDTGVKVVVPSVKQGGLLGTLTLIEYKVLAPALSVRVIVNEEDVDRRVIAVGENVRVPAEYDTKEGRVYERVIAYPSSSIIKGRG
jgi:hypothetical protein